MIYGYARVSTKGQASDGTSLESQREVLTEAGAEEIFCEAYTGTKRDRPELTKLLTALRPGDKVVVTKLDRVARSTVDGIQIIDEIVGKGCSIEILNMGKFDDTPVGKLMRTVMLAFAEFERNMIVERTQEGKRAKRSTTPDYTEGRPYLEIPDFEKFFQMKKDSEISVTEACKKLGISRSKWYSLCRERETIN